MEKKNKVNTSIKIDSELWKNAKKTAIDTDTSVSELVEKGLRNEIEKIKKELEK